jgi:hypothetical protein
MTGTDHSGPSEAIFRKIRNKRIALILPLPYDSP